MRAVEPDPAAQAWGELDAQIIDSTLLPRANSWWLRATIPGEPRQSLSFHTGAIK